MASEWEEYRDQVAAGTLEFDWDEYTGRLLASELSDQAVLTECARIGCGVTAESLAEDRAHAGIQFKKVP